MHAYLQVAEGGGQQGHRITAAFCVQILLVNVFHKCNEFVCLFGFIGRTIALPFNFNNIRIEPQAERKCLIMPALRNNAINVSYCLLYTEFHTSIGHKTPITAILETEMFHIIAWSLNTETQSICSFNHFVNAAVYHRITNAEHQPNKVDVN